MKTQCPTNLAAEAADEPKDLESLNDWKLLEAWRSGDQVSGQTLLKRYTRFLGRFFHKRVDNFDDVADMVSETLLGCVRALDRVRDPGAFRSYLVSCAMNNLRLYYRKKAKRSRETGDFAMVCVGDAIDPRSPNSVISVRRKSHFLVCALRRIPLDQQIVLKMKYFEGLNGAEIADILGIPKQTAYTRLRRGEEKLRALVTGSDPSPEGAESTAMGLQSWAAQLCDELPH